MVEKVQAVKAPRFYPTEPTRRALKTARAPRPTRLRKSIRPGTILILLAGKFRGKRVVFLKQLKSGLLLVTGPYKVNGVPIRRVNQAYVIATSTKVDLGEFSVPEKFSDAYFKKDKATKKKGAEEFFDEKEKKAVDPVRQADQKEVDDVVLKAVTGVPQLKGYLSTLFTLSNKQAPHALKF